MLSPDLTFNTIIDVVQLYPTLTIQELHNHLVTKVKISLPNLYKIVADLIEKQILLKHHKQLSLHPIRVAHIKSLHDTIILGKKSSSPLITIVPGTISSFKAKSLRDLDAIWFAVLQYCVEQTPSQEQWYFYNSHEYHILGMYETEQQGFQTLSHHGKYPLKFLVGNDMYLDRYALGILQDTGCLAVNNPTTLFPKQGYFLNLYGDYIVEVVLPSPLAQYFEVYYQTVDDMSQFPQELFAQLFDLSMDIWLTAQYDPQQAKIYRQQMDRCMKV